MVPGRWETQRAQRGGGRAQRPLVSALGRTGCGMRARPDAPALSPPAGGRHGGGDHLGAAHGHPLQGEQALPGCQRCPCPCAPAGTLTPTPCHPGPASRLRHRHLRRPGCVQRLRGGVRRDPGRSSGGPAAVSTGSPRARQGEGVAGPAPGPCRPHLPWVLPPALLSPAASWSVVAPVALGLVVAEIAGNFVAKMALGPEGLTGEKDSTEPRKRNRGKRGADRRTWGESPHGCRTPAIPALGG